MKPTRQVRLYELGRSKPSTPTSTMPSAFTSSSSHPPVLMSEPRSSFYNSHASGCSDDNLSRESKPKAPLQTSPINLISSESLGLPSSVVDVSSASPVSGDTASKSTRSSVDKDYGGVSLTAYGKLREVDDTSTNTMQGHSMLEQLQNLEIEDYGKTADRKVSETPSSESPHFGRQSTPRLSSDGNGKERSIPFEDAFPRQENPYAEYGNISSQPRKGIGSSYSVAHDISREDNSHRESGDVVASPFHDERSSQTFPQTLKKISPPIVPGAAPWNDSVWDNYWLHKPEMVYRREPDIKSTFTISPNASIEDDSSYRNLSDDYNRPHAAQALADGLRNTTEEEIRHHGLNARELTVQVSREQATKEGFTGMTDLILKSALHRRARQNWVERRGLLARYARLMGYDPITATAKSEVINLAAVIDKCRDGSAPWLRDTRPCRREQLCEQICQAVFGSANGDPQLSPTLASYIIRFNQSWLTLGELRRELFAIIDTMVDEMIDPDYAFIRAQDQLPPLEANYNADDMLSSKRVEAHVLQSTVQRGLPTLGYEDMVSPVGAHSSNRVQVNDPEVGHLPQVSSRTEVHGRRYEMSRAQGENAQYYRSASSRLPHQSPGTGAVPYQHSLNADRRPLPTDVNRQPIFPVPVNRNGQMPMQQWGSQGLGPVSRYPGMHLTSMPGFVHYVPYPMLPQLQTGYPMYGQPQYQGAFVQSPVPQQQYTAPQGCLNMEALGVNAASRPGFVLESSQQASTSQRQLQETQRASTAYHNGTNSRNTEWSNRFGRPGSVQPSLPMLPYRPGSDDMFPQTAVEGASVKLQELTRNGPPSLAMATSREIAPFAETARNTKSAEWGVVKIGNIPYSLTKQEVLGFLGRNAKIVTPDLGVPIHIIMDRSTGKTMDCYVEFFSNGDASAAVNKCNMRGHQLRLGDRAIDIELSSQDKLLKQLFPRAKNVVWTGGVPIIKESHEPFNTGFKSFVTGEEMVMVVRHAEQPHRSSYTQKCPQRAYECMISTLAKFPWFAVDNYTITTRDQLFAATRDQLKTLSYTVNRGGQPGLTETLLNDLLMAGLNAYGFSERQRWELRQAAGFVGSKIAMSPLAKGWPFEALGRKAGVEEDVVEFYADLLSHHPSTLSSESRFGKLAYSKASLSNKMLREVGAVEWELLEELLRGLLT